MLRFLDPAMATGLLCVPIAFGFWLLHVRAKHRFRERAAIGPVLQRLSRLTSGRRDAVALLASSVALAGLALALMRPQLFAETRVPDYERQDLVLILDRSASMRAQDVAPSRFARAVAEIKTFLAGKPDGIDRVGLVGFAGSALVLSHFTRDMGSLSFYLDWTRDDAELHFGTDIGKALASARELSRKDTRPTKKVFLLLSDGDDQGAELQRQLAELRQERARVHCIGIGSERESPIPVPREGGGAALLQDEQGRPLLSRFDEKTLRRIASETGGRYFRSSTGGELLGAMREVVKQERKLQGWKSSTDYRDVHRVALMAAAAAAFVLLFTL
jgi:Ca-activated chloride channel family protein